MVFLHLCLLCAVTERCSEQLPGKQMQYYSSAVLFLNISRVGLEKVFLLFVLVLKDGGAALGEHLEALII